MNLPISFAVLALACVPGLAHAQAGAQSPAPTAASGALSTGAAAPVVAAPGAQSFCELGENIGVEPSDALVASRLVCGEVLAKARVAGKIPPATYRINFGKLGSRILMQVAEYGDGTRLSDERHVQLLAIEDVSSIAKRMAESLVYNTPIADLESTENVLPADALERRQKQGRMHFEAGLVGAMQVGSKDMAPKPGIQLGLTYELKRAYLAMSFRAAGGDRTSLVDIGLGGGSYFSDADIAPFVGGGVSWMGHGAPTDADSASTISSASGSGFAPYAEAGLGIFRTSKTGLRAGLRASIPTYSLKSSSYDAQTRSYGDKSTYVIPVVASVTMSF